MDSKITKKIVQRLNTVFSKFDEIVACYLFGSICNGYATNSSDIDIGILFNKNVNIKKELEIAVECDLTLNCEKVHIINLNNASINLAFRIISTGRLIYEKNNILHADYLEKLFKQYHDFRPKYEQFIKEYNQALREEYLK